MCVALCPKLNCSEVAAAHNLKILSSFSLRYTFISEKFFQTYCMEQNKDTKEKLI